MNTTERILRIAEGLSWAPTREHAFSVMDLEMKDLFQPILFTILLFDRERETMVRLYSNRPDLHPIGGTKPITDTTWTRLVVQKGEIFIARNEDELRAAFFDHELLFSIGCQSAMNVPFRWKGVVIGSMNLLGTAQAYNTSHRRLGLVCGQLLAPMRLGDRLTFEGAECLSSKEYD
ncbi:hypothetical protein N185_16745 [Sinorhizobium sp. GW3]|nr:hypothetical protein N185_16745 [Sinorhizobium sp. GW3]